MIFYMITACQITGPNYPDLEPDLVPNPGNWDPLFGSDHIKYPVPATNHYLLSRLLKVLIISASTTSFGKLFQILTTLEQNEYFLVFMCCHCPIDIMALMFVCVR